MQRRVDRCGDNTLSRWLTLRARCCSAGQACRRHSHQTRLLCCAVLCCELVAPIREDLSQAHIVSITRIVFLPKTTSKEENRIVSCAVSAATSPQPTRGLRSSATGSQFLGLLSRHVRGVRSTKHQRNVTHTSNHHRNVTQRNATQRDKYSHVHSVNPPLNFIELWLIWSHKHTYTAGGMTAGIAAASN